MAWNWEWSVLNGIQKWMRSPFWDEVMPKISMLGNAGLIWIAAAIGLLAFKKHRRGGVLLLIGLFCGLLVGNVLLKNSIARPRPSWLNDAVTLLIPNPTDYAFPSGHTLSSTIAATILTLEKRSFGWVAVPLALLIAFSRLYLYVHFPTDVLAGLLLGVFIGFAVWKWLRPVTERWTLKP